MKPEPEEIKNQLRKFNLMGYADESIKYENNGKNGIGERLFQVLIFQIFTFF